MKTAASADNKARYWTLRNAGLCVGCKGDPAPGMARCRRCADAIIHRSPGGLDARRARDRVYAADRRARRLAAGQCPKCGKANRSTSVDCRPCRRKETRRKIAYQSKGGPQRHCRYCGALGHNRTSCETRERDEHRATVLAYAGARHAA